MDGARVIGDRRPPVSARRPPARSTRSAGTSRRRLLPGRRLPRPHPRLVGALLVLVAIAVGGWFWLRDSSLVAVRTVRITGVSGPDARQIRAALTSAARTMTTLDVNTAALRTAIQPFPVVKHIHTSTSFPHGIAIDVSEQVPVAFISAGGPQLAVAGDGSLLRDAAPPGVLPTITVGIAPGGDHVTGMAAADVRLLAAAPYALLGRIASASDSQQHGLTIVLRNGPRVYFGGAGQAATKWSSLDAVLADQSSSGADYIDVSVPSRPVAGVGPDTAANSGPAGSASTTPQNTSPGTSPGGTTGASTSSGTTPTGSTNPTGG